MCTGRELKNLTVSVCMSGGGCEVCAVLPGQVEIGGPVELFCVRPVLGDQVLVALNQPGRLQICELEVYSQPTTGNSVS